MSLKENVLRATCLKHQIAVSRGPLLTTSRSTSLRRCSQTVTPLRLRAMQIKAFWDYQSFITASAYFQPYGFGTTYINRKFTGTKEVAAFLAHVATKTSCEFKVSLLWNFNLEFHVVGLVEYMRLTTSFLSGFDFIGSKWIWGYKFGFK